MWQRIRRELLIEYYWWKRHRSVNERSLDSPFGVMGILIVTSSVFFLVIIGRGIAAFFRNLIPVVGGAQVAGVYWSSVILALKICLTLIILIISIVVFIYIKFFGRNSSRRF